MQLKKNKTQPIKTKAGTPKPTAPSIWAHALMRPLALIVSIVGCIVYAQSLGFNFALDDYSAIIENRQTKQGFDAIGEIFKSSYRYGYNIQGDELYRPLSKAAFAVLWEIAPNNAFPFHLLNLLMYGLTGYLLFITLQRFTANLYVSFIASLLFVTHPIHVEVVANIKSLDEILGFLFFVVALNLLHRYLEKKQMGTLLLSLASFFLALLSKESSITFVLIFPLFVYFFSNNSVSQTVSKTWLYWIPVLVFLAIRYSILKDNHAGAPSVADNSLMAAPNFLIQKCTAIVIMGMYAKLILFPHPLVFDYSFNQIPLSSITDWRFLLSFSFYALLLFIAIKGFMKKSPYSMAIIMFFIVASVSSNILMVIGTNMAERLMYAPVLAYCLGVAFLLDTLVKNADINTNSLLLFFKTRKALMTSVMLITLFYSVKAIAYSSVWRNNITLYESGIVNAPLSTRTHFYLGNAICKPDYYEKFPKETQLKIIERGIAELKKSAEIYPAFSEPWAQLGVVYYKKKDLDSAMYYYNKALSVAPYLATVHNNVGTVYFETGKYNEAISAFDKATQFDPNYSEAWCNLGSAYGTIGQMDAAIQHFLTAIKCDPNNVMALKFLGITYQNKGDQYNARLYLDMAAQAGEK
jgi:hypothetical protein